MQLSKAQPATRKSQLFAQIKTAMDNKIIEVQKHILDKLVQYPSNPDDQKLLIDFYNILETFITSSSFSSTIEPITNISPAW